jgi:hypothetical protein
MSLTAIPINLQIDCGSDWEVTFNLSNSNGQYIDLTGYSLSCKMAKNYTTTIKYDLNPQIIIPNSGLIRLFMPNTGGPFVTKTQDIKPGRYVYSLLITNQQGKTDRAIEGIVTVTPAVQ